MIAVKSAFEVEDQDIISFYHSLAVCDEKFYNYKETEWLQIEQSFKCVGNVLSGSPFDLNFNDISFSDFVYNKIIL